MNCEQWRNQSADLVGDELPPAERGELESHARECASCGADLDDMRRVVQAVQALRPDDDSVALAAVSVPMPEGFPRAGRAFVAIARYAAVIAFAFFAGYASRGGSQSDSAAQLAVKPANVNSTINPPIHPQIAQNYQRAADRHPNASTLGLSLLSIARR
ncbi:MAG: zf-HC2 domain-containing protein [Phycisphaerales bacterium]|nr:zf-HC2 domain-containing protein [Phycisphaerales bacterium]